MNTDERRSESRPHVFKWIAITGSQNSSGVLSVFMRVHLWFPLFVFPLRENSCEFVSIRVPHF
jgi:hypothetical protein